VIDYADLLINGVKNNLEKIDSTVQKVSQHWKLDRMAIVDRNLLRMAIFEMLVMKDPLTPNIVINEAIELAKKYGSTDSASFINGLLDQAAKESR
jgi:N utilization substance protein B